MERAAVHDLDEMEAYHSEAEQVETAVASAVLYEPLLMSLRRPAQSEESARRYGLSQRKGPFTEVKGPFPTALLYPRPDSNRRYCRERAAC